MMIQYSMDPALKKVVFTFGTLYEPRITKALLGELPDYFDTELVGFSIYRGGTDQLPDQVKQDIITHRGSLDGLTYHFAKPDESENVITGRAWMITDLQEKILDAWERYPAWYQKQDVQVRDKQGHLKKAIAYTQDGDGDPVDLAVFERVPGGVQEYISEAKRVREDVLNHI